MIKRTLEPTKLISGALPKILVEEMDAMVIGSDQYKSRTHFITLAIKEKIDKERKLKEKELLENLDIDT